LSFITLMICPMKCIDSKMFNAYNACGPNGGGRVTGKDETPGSDPEAERERDAAVARILELLPLLLRKWSHEQRGIEWPEELSGGIADLQALYVIARCERITAGELARRLWISESAGTAVINRLETAGLVRREREVRDRRVVHLVLTERGAQILEQADAVRNAQIRGWFRELDAAEVRQLVTLFEKMARAGSDEGTPPAPDERGAMQP
jgi:DNA-binding MarR family transcriptional regulator